MARHARPADHEAIRTLVDAAYERPDEARLIERLRADGDVVFELVEERDGRLVGHLLTSRLWADSQALYAALAPLSVAPEAQGQGVGAGLMAAAIETARDFGAAALLVLGDPAYYGRFGFEAETASRVRCPYSGQHLMGLELDNGALAEPLLVAYPAGFASF